MAVQFVERCTLTPYLENIQLSSFFYTAHFSEFALDSWSHQLNYKFIPSKFCALLCWEHAYSF